MIDGIYMNGKTSKRVKARLEVFSDYDKALSLHLDDGDNVGTIHIMLGELQISSRLGNTPREISFSDEQLFITDNNDAVDDLEKNHGQSKYSRFIHKLESSFPLVIAATLIALACVWLTFTVGIPQSAKYIAFQLPEMTSKHFGSTLYVLDETMFDPSELDSETQERIQALSQPYLSQYDDLNAKLIFRSGSGVNAFALPDGHIVFTDGIVRLMKHDEELIAVLFHELGHLKYKHMLRRTLQDSMVALFIILVTGDVDSFDLITGIPTLLLDLNYSQDFEREADHFAIEQLHHNDFELDYFASMMKRLNFLSHKKISTEIDDEDSQKMLKKVLDFLSTHPAAEERVAMVAAYKKKHGITNNETSLFSE